MNQLYKWYQLCEQLARDRAAELVLREELVREYFPDLLEGTNQMDLPGNAELVAVQPYNYCVDTDTLETAMEHIPATKQHRLVTWLPVLDQDVYNGLTKKARKAFTAECVVITPGTPSLQIVTKS